MNRQTANILQNLQISGSAGRGLVAEDIPGDRAAGKQLVGFGEAWSLTFQSIVHRWLVDRNWCQRGLVTLGGPATAAAKEVFKGHRRRRHGRNGLPIDIRLSEHR